MDNYRSSICFLGKKVYPNLKEKEAIKRLWLDIIKCSRLEGDPIKNWDNHIKYLAAKADILNKLDLSYLHYKSSNGTDLKLKLHPLYTFISARETNLRGISFSANIPTEEVFSMPDKYGVDGIVYSSKPLSYNSMLIQDFYLKFENGKVVEAKAKVGQDVLLEILNTDEGSSYLGEVALVPYSSPVNKCGVLFYDTLFDENACCHLALGQAFKNNFRNYENMSEEDFKKNNYNDSLIHVDFMIGTSDLQIDGYKKDGTKITIFENGSWAI